MAWLATPWGLLALMSLPVLTGIYLLRRKPKPRVVSALFLWQTKRIQRDKGVKLTVTRLPWIYFLEFIILALLVLAACSPFILKDSYNRSLWLVLDDSFSMQSQTGLTNVRGKALQWMDSELGLESFHKIHVVLAGSRPNLIAKNIENKVELFDRLKSWECLSSKSDMPASLLFVRKLLGTNDVIQVISDHKMPETLPVAELKWKSLAKPLSNVSLVTAARTSYEDKERILVELKSHSASRVQSELKILNHKTGQVLIKKSVELEAGKRKKLSFQLKSDIPLVKIQLASDALLFDNEAFLLSEKPAVVKVSNKVQSKRLSKDVAEALKATSMVVESSVAPHLTISEKEETGLAQNNWSFQLQAVKADAAYVGPFLKDTTHPLLQGVSLEGVIWGAKNKNKTGTVPILSVGQYSLLSEDLLSWNGKDKRRQFLMQIDPSRSNVQQTPFWPILLWNLVQLRSEHLPGIRPANLTIGNASKIHVGDEVDTIKMYTPDKKIKTLNVYDNIMEVSGDRPGLYTIEAGIKKYDFVCNPLSDSEGNLLDHATGSWGNWPDESSYTRQIWPYAWLLAIIAALLIAWHTHLLRRGEAKGI